MFSFAYSKSREAKKLSVLGPDVSFLLKKVCIDITFACFSMFPNFERNKNPDNLLLKFVALCHITAF